MAQQHTTASASLEAAGYAAMEAGNASANADAAVMLLQSGNKKGGLEKLTWAAEQAQNATHRLQQALHLLKAEQGGAA